MNCSLAAVSVSYQKHSSPSDDHSDINHRRDLWNWDILGYIGMIFGVCLGQEIKVPSWKMGMKEFSKCVKPGHFKSVSSVSRTMWVRRFDLAICGNFFPIFVQALKCPSSGTLRVFITWRRWINSVQFGSAWTYLTSVKWNDVFHYIKVTKKQYDSCSKFKSPEVDKSGKFTWTAPKTPGVRAFVKFDNQIWVNSL